MYNSASTGASDGSRGLRGKPHLRDGFDFTSHMRQICLDICQRLPDFRHVDMTRVAVSFSRARRRVRHGLQATLTPLRFENGASTGVRRGRQYTVQRVVDGQQREMLYILSFYLPRFLDLGFREKLVTVFHELWHINPRFDGDIRRHPGRCYAHSHSQADYDREMGRLVDRWLELDPPAAAYEFLRDSFDDLHRRHGRIFGTRIRTPKLIPVS